MVLLGAEALEAAFAAAASGGGSKMLGRDPLVQMLGYAWARGYVVDAIEVYELKDDLEYPQVDLTLLGGDLVRETLGMPPEAITAHILGAVEETITAADRLTFPASFQVWLAPAP